MRRYAFFTILGHNFRKIRANLQGNLYIYLHHLQNIWSHWEDQEDLQEEDIQHEENHAPNGRPSNILLAWMFIPVCRHHFFEIQLYVLVDIQAQQCIQVLVPRYPLDIVLRGSDLTIPRAELAPPTRACHGGDQQQTLGRFGNRFACPRALRRKAEGSKNRRLVRLSLPHCSDVCFEETEKWSQKAALKVLK